MCLYTPVMMTNEHPNGFLEAKSIIGGEGTSNLSHPGFLPLPQTIVSKVREVQYPQHLRCHLDRTAQMGPDILDEEGGIEKKCI